MKGHRSNSKDDEKKKKEKKEKEKKAKEKEKVGLEFYVNIYMPLSVWCNVCQ